MKLLVCLPFYTGDGNQMEKTARVACDLLEELTNQAEIMFVPRFDTDAPSMEIQNLAASKFFKVHVWRCPTKYAGFPAGCNAMAYGLLNHVSGQRCLNEGFFDIDAILILESDCVITRRDWVRELCGEWQEAINQNKLVAGALQHRNGDIQEHINAVALYDPDVACVLPCLRGGPSHLGWDHYHGPSVVPYALDSKLFKLDYRRPTITPDQLFSDDRVLIYHGVKDDSALNAVRSRYLL